jgi:hypothetical protein
MTCMYRPEEATGFKISVWMEVKDGERQLFGSVQLNGPELCDPIERLHGKSLLCIFQSH